MDEKLIWSAISDKELLAQVAERGLSLPRAVGAIAAVGTEVEMPSYVRGQLLATTAEGAGLYLKAIKGINAKRDKKDRIPTHEVGEYRERAEDWLTDNLVAAASHLPETDNRPRLIVPRLNRAITAEEIVEAWARGSDKGLRSWSGREGYLNYWSANHLSGFDPEADPDEARFQILPTAYDKYCEGTVSNQNERLTALQIEVPELHVAVIFDGVVLGRRYKGKSRTWLDTYVRAIDLRQFRDRGYDSVPDAFVNDDGGADVGVSSVLSECPARLVAR